MRVGRYGSEVARRPKIARATEPEGPYETRFVQPYEALKEYRCPACDHPIPERTHHIVVIPTEEPEARRHWHRACWDRIKTRPR
jgi:hypothetical protein